VGLIRDLIYGPDTGPILRAVPDPVPETSDPPGLALSVEQQIAEAIAWRISTFTLEEALEMPAVIRAVELLCAIPSMFRPIAYRDGVALLDQPRLLTQPAPFGSRSQFYYQTIYSLLAMRSQHGRGGDAYWFVVDRDDDDLARSMIVLDPGEVRVEWDKAHFLPVYSWRGLEGPDLTRDLIHLTIGRPPGQLHGRSPLIMGLGALAVVNAAELYALGYFTTAGVPSAVIKGAGKGSPEEAQRLKAQWMAAHNTEAPTPAVLFGGLDVEFPNVDAQKSQLQESRAYGATITARLLGIPAPLLHVETSGATIVYTNAGGALDDLVRATCTPSYLTPIEGYLSTLVPRTQTVRFDTNDLFRLDLAGRVKLYAEAIAAGVLNATEARRFEGWPTDGEIQSAPAFAPTPALPTFRIEVPANV